jgi:6-phosphofructokinase 1
LRIGILTSGGDAPGMNAAVRAVARTAFFKGWDVMGIWSGYKGLLEGRIYPMDRRRLGGIIHRGGTVLGTERSAEFATPEGQRKAAGKLAEAGVEGLVVVGGNGSLTGGSRLAELGVEVVGVPATIDNDVWGTDTAIGVDTALNTALEAIDRIKDTASSHQRAHIVEVMGRDSGYLALMSAIAGGAEAAVVPEFEPSPENLLLFIKKAFEQGKSHFVVVVAEGAPSQPKNWMNTSTGRRVPTTRASRSSATSNAAAFPRPRTGSSRAGSARPRSRPWPKGSLARWSRSGGRG